MLVRLNMRAVEYGPIKRSLLPASKTDTVLERMSEAAFRDIIIKVIIYFMYFFGGVAPRVPSEEGYVEAELQTQPRVANR